MNFLILNNAKGKGGSKASPFKGDEKKRRGWSLVAITRQHNALSFPAVRLRCNESLQRVEQRPSDHLTTGNVTRPATKKG